MYKLVSNLYKLHRITAQVVWAYADAGKITEQEAATICGPRPV